MAAFGTAFRSEKKLTLIFIRIISAIYILAGVRTFDATTTAKHFKSYAEAASCADNLFRTIRAYSLGSRALARYYELLRSALKLGDNKSQFVGTLFEQQAILLIATAATSTT